MSCFDVKILDPNINTIEIETCIGDQPASIDIVTYDNTSTVEINHCVALLPSEINDLITVKDIIAGSGISVSDSSGIYTVSLSNPTISSSGIVDFLESAQDIIGNSGLVGGNYININYDDNTGFTTVSATGLQPSGNYSLVGHTHISSNITDFDSSVSGLLPVKNISAGSGIGITSVSGDFTVSVTGTFGLTSEEVDDRVSNLLVAGNYISLNYNDLGNSLTISVTGLQPSGNYSVVGHSHVIADVSGLQNALDGKQPSGNYSVVGHNHNASDITNFASEVSGLLPSVSGSGYILSSFINNIYTISASGLQPSGNYSLVGHNHVSTDITDSTSFGRNILTASSYEEQNYLGWTIVNNNLTAKVGGQYYFPTKASPPVITVPFTYAINDPIGGTTGDFYYIIKPSNSIASAIVGGITYPSDSGIFIERYWSVDSVILSPPSTSGSWKTRTLDDYHKHTSSQITDFNSAVSGLIPPSNFTSLSGVNGIDVSNSGTDYTVALASSGNFDSLTVNNIDVSVSGHNHVYTDITNFASGVDAALSTALIAGTGIYLYEDTLANTLNINVTGVSMVGHTHTSSNITDFNSSVSGLLPSFTGVSGVVVSSSGNNYTISLSDPTIQLTDITDLSANARTFLLTPSSNNLSTLVNDETGSGALVFNNSPAFSGIPTVPTATSGTNTNQIASTSFVRTEISNLVDSAPSTLDTLNELAAALGDDPNFATTITNTLSGKANLSGAIFTGPVTIPSGTGNFNSLTVNGTNVSISGHTHTSSEITDFNSGVSGLLPSVTGTGYITSSFAGNIYTVGVTGLQPSGNYSVVGHTHISSDITDFNSSVSGLIPVKNILSGTGITVSNASGIYTIEATGSGVLSDQAKSLVTTVFNKTGSPIPKMTAVYINGGQGDMPTVALAIATADMTSAGTYGLTYEAIPNMQSGQVIVFGALTGLDTDQFNPTAPTGNVNGSVLYLSPSVSGALTLTKPSAPNHIVAIGTIVRTHQNEGVIEVRVQNGFELEELHNVAISGVTNGQFLQYNSGTQLWVPSSSGNFTTLQVSGTLVPTGVGIANHIAYWDTTNSITADSGQLYWDSSNNRLGIGTSAPSGHLDVAGDVYVRGTGNNLGTVYFKSTSAGETTHKVRVDTNGNLYLDAGAYIKVGSQDGTAMVQGYTGPVTIGHLSNSSANQNIIFNPRNSEKARLTHDGKFGIGISAPSGELHVVGSGFFSGRVGIGTTSPIAPLDVITGAKIGSASDVNPGSGSELVLSNTATAGMVFQHNGNNTVYIRSNPTNLRIGNNGGDAITVTHSNRNIGIGTSSPSYKLDVIGTGNFSQNLLVNGTGVSLTGHTHTTSNITDFNTSVSGLLPTISNSGDNRILTSTGSSTGINAESNLTFDGSTLNIDGNLVFDSFTESVVAIGNSSTSQTLSLTSGTVQTCTLTNNCTFTMPTATAGKSFTMFLNTGSGNYTASFSGVLWSDSAPPTITTTANKADILSFISDGTYWYGSYSQNYG